MTSSAGRRWNRAAAIAGVSALLSSILLHHASAAPASTAVWCWSMQSGTVYGTFTTNGSIPGDGSAPAGTYTLSSFTVQGSAFPDIEAGSTTDGTYALNIAPSIAIVWSGATVTDFTRSNGTLTGGFSVNNGPGDAGAYFDFEKNYQRVLTKATGGTRLFFANVQAAITPLGSPSCSTGSSGGDTASGPADILQQFGRGTFDATCIVGWGPSYAMWVNEGAGGWVCTRTLGYDPSTQVWIVR